VGRVSSGAPAAIGLRATAAPVAAKAWDVAVEAVVSHEASRRAMRASESFSLSGDLRGSQRTVCFNRQAQQQKKKSRRRNETGGVTIKRQQQRYSPAPALDVLSLKAFTLLPEVVALRLSHVVIYHRKSGEVTSRNQSAGLKSAGQAKAASTWAK